MQASRKQGMVSLTKFKVSWDILSDKWLSYWWHHTRQEKSFENHRKDGRSRAFYKPDEKEECNKTSCTNSPRFFDKALEIASTFREPISPKASMSSMCLVMSWRLFN